jgi:hypothetical protein
VGGGGHQTHLRKHGKLLARHLAALHGLPDTVIATLHEPPLEADRVPQEAVALELGGSAAALARGEALELRVELCVAALGQQQQQVQAGDAVALGQRGGQHGGGELVEGAQLGHVAGEGLWVPRLDAVEGALLVGLPREGEDVLGRLRRLLLLLLVLADVDGVGGRGRGQGVELQEQQFCLGEEGEGVGVAVGGVLGFQLGDNLLQLAFGRAFGHCVWVGSQACAATASWGVGLASV